MMDACLIVRTIAYLKLNCVENVHMALNDTYLSYFIFIMMCHCVQKLQKNRFLPECLLRLAVKRISFVLVLVILAWCPET